MIGRLLSIATIVALAVPAIAAEPDPIKLCSQHIPFGLPTIIAGVEGTLICRPAAYLIQHDDRALVPRFVSYELDAEHTFGCHPRTDHFHAEPLLSKGQRAIPDDYDDSGYDQGHQAPADDLAWSDETLELSFSLANIAPQRPGLNRQGWERLEEAVRTWAWVRGRLIVLVGPVLAPASTVIGKNHVAVPVGFFKVVVDPARREALAFFMPQADESKSQALSFVTSIAEIEARAGIKVPLPEGISRGAIAAPWPADIGAWKRAKHARCALAAGGAG